MANKLEILINLVVHLDVTSIRRAGVARADYTFLPSLNATHCSSNNM